MPVNTYLITYKWRAKIISVTSLIILVFTYFSAKAQYSYGDNNPSYGIAVSAGYEAPIANLAYTFKAAPAYEFKVLSYHDNITINGSIGYRAFKPKLDTFYYAVDEANYGTIEYQNFTVLSLYIGGAYNLEINDGLKVYAGFDLGAYYTHMVYHLTDEFEDQNADLHQEDAYLAPKLGFTYSINDNMALGIEAKYNLFSPVGQKVDNPAVGTLYNSYSGHLVLTYNF